MEPVERRKQCGQHKDLIDTVTECKKALSEGDKRMEGIEGKIDMVLDRQLAYMDNQVVVSSDITRIKAIVENGLRKNVEELSIAAMAVHDKVELLDDFTWFIKTVNSLRDGIMRKLIVASLAGGIIVVLYSALSAISAKEIPKLLSKLLG